MISEVRFRNFKGLRSVDVELGRLTVLVGPNASGKTSVLQGIEYLSDLLSGYSPKDWFRDSRSPFFLFSRHGEGSLVLEAIGDSSDLRLQAAAKQPLPASVLTPEGAVQHRDLWDFQFEQKTGDNAEAWQP